jgi:hypothetical protein
VKRVGVKYCGGCNPGLDRRAAYEQVKAEVADMAGERGIDVVFETAEEGIAYDALLVVCGCANRCASIEQYEAGTDPVYVWGKDSRADTSAQVIEKIGGR